MKSVTIYFDDKDFNKLVAMKTKTKGKVDSWRDFILKLAKIYEGE